MEEEVLLSTDIGSDIDDALSLLSMINRGINLKSINTVNGDVLSRAFIAKHIVDLAKENIDVTIGESKPIGGNVEPYSFNVECHVQDRFIDDEKSEENCNTTYRSPEEFDIELNGIEDLANKLSNDKYTLFSIGPMTNIAKLIKKYPETTKNIEKIYIMGFRSINDNKLEHNVRHDIPAAKILFDSQLPLVIIPSNLCERYRMPVKQLHELITEAGKYVKKMAYGFLATKTAIEFRTNNLEELIKNRVFIIPDKNKYNKSSAILQKAYKKDGLMTNLDDDYYGSYDPGNYFKQYYRLIKHLKDPKLDYVRGKAVAKILESLVPTEISIPDVYIPYCFQNPGKIKTEQGSVEIDGVGLMQFNNKGKHTFVKDIDFDDFKKYVKNNIR